MKKILILVLIVFLLIAGRSVYENIYAPFKGYSGEIIIEVKKGQSVKTIAENLEKNGVISSKLFFLVYYKLFSSEKTIRNGKYIFSEPLSTKKVLERLLSGKVLVVNLTIKEGMSINEIAALIEEKGIWSERDFLREASNIDLISDIDPEAHDLEGYLFPETYEVSSTDSPETLINAMVKIFRQRFKPEWKMRMKEFGFSLRQTITLASLIEKETADTSERFLISSVFHNRLKRKMLLDCDPTIVYILKKSNLYKGRLTWDDLKYPSRYNTRLYPGLPPGPICNPGLESIEAALYPQKSDYLYFVSKDGKKHVFSTNLDEHNRNVYKYIKSR